MRKAIWSAIVSAGLFAVWATPAHAQATDTASLTVTVNVAARATLVLDTPAIVFNDADPDLVPVLTAAPVTIDIRARTTPSATVTLTVQATQDLTAGGGATIPISGLTWSATGTGFQAGTSSTAAAQTVGSWTGSGSATGTQTYSLPNSWSYAIGTYTTTLNYTLTAP